MLDIGDRKGVQRKTVRVYTDNSQTPALLTMVTEIPVVLEMSPRFLFWKQGAMMDTKSVDLKVGLDQEVAIDTVEPINEDFEYELLTVEPGRLYRLLVTPKTTGKSRGMFSIRTNFPEENPRFTAYTHMFVSRAQLGKVCVIVGFSAVLAVLNALSNPYALSWDENTLKPGEIHAEDAREMERVFFVDARPEADYQRDHISGATNLTEDDWDDQLMLLFENWDVESPIVVYCSSMECQASHAVAERLKQELGFEEIYVLKGGWEQWNATLE